MTRVLITGSRKFQSKAVIESALKIVCLYDGFENCRLVHGAAKGADSLSANVAKKLGIGDIQAYPADWDRHGKKAGYVRNAEMVALGHDVCLAFFSPDHENRGTQMCANLAEKAGITVLRFRDRTGG